VEKAETFLLYIRERNVNARGASGPGERGTDLEGTKAPTSRWVAGTR